MTNDRYSRQKLYPPIADAGQAAIAASSVLLVGCGALGTHLAEFCVRAGVAKLTIVDRDFVEFSNLQRQSLFTEEDAKACNPKAVTAADALRHINSACEINAHITDFNFRNAEELATDASLILDASDNFETRFLINDLSIKLNIPWVYAGCIGASAMCMPVTKGNACLTCLLEDQPDTGGETCDTSGIIMPAVLQAVAWSSICAMKILSGNTNALFNKLFSVDMWSGEKSILDASTPRPNCPTCGQRDFKWLNGEQASRTTKLCGRDSVQITPAGNFDFAAVVERLSNAGKILTSNEYLARVIDGEAIITLYKDGRALVHDCDDEVQAKARYSRLIG
ncbi:MAG: ThiF family adenylyltransferase [Planctomycetes bacterium]|nr:ThiF family adenylyltransferase [Planctomycetota bacterium]